MLIAVTSVNRVHGATQPGRGGHRGQARGHGDRDLHRPYRCCCRLQAQDDQADGAAHRLRGEGDFRRPCAFCRACSFRWACSFRCPRAFRCSCAFRRPCASGQVMMARHVLDKADGRPR